MTSLHTFSVCLVAGITGALLACAHRSSQAGSSTDRQIYSLDLKRVTTPGPNGEPVTYWAGQVPEQLVRDIMGDDAVNTCAERLQSGSRDCLGRLSSGVQFRFMSVESDSAWWIEFDAVGVETTTREWIFSTQAADGSVVTSKERF